MPPGLPGWRRAACLGCTEVVSEARPPWVVIVGSRDGAHLFAFPTGPERGASTFDPYEPPPDVFILGVAHEACRERAAERLRKREISLASELPQLSFEPFPELVETFRQPHTDRDRCPFCGTEGPLTDEDIFPVWLQKAVDEWASQSLRGPGNPWRAYLVPVCGNCNSRWMSTLENDTSKIIKRMLVSTSTELAESDQLRLATWATKVAFLLEYWSTSGQLPHEFLQALAVWGRPPPGTGVWLGAHSPTAAMSAKIDWIPGTDGHEVDPVGLWVTFSVGTLVFLVLTRFDGRYAAPASHQLVAQALVPLWPPSDGVVAWPRDNLSLGKDGVGFLTEVVDVSGVMP